LNGSQASSFSHSPVASLSLLMENRVLLLTPFSSRRRIALKANIACGSLLTHWSEPGFMAYTAPENFGAVGHVVIERQTVAR
jgi:hypothetical protein